jgi:2-alkyl-3-oxoalkanoate reductase
MRVFLTGATGVIGRRAIPDLVAAGHRVTAVGRAPDKRELLARLGATPVQVDLFDAAALSRAVDGHDAVVNLATHIPPTSRVFLPGAWRENDRIRRVVAATLVDAAIAGGATHFVQESFAPIYPDRGAEWIDERSPVRPTRYNRTVLDAEAAAARFAGSGRAGVVLRFALFYGPDSGFTLDTIRYVRKGWAPAPGSPDGFVSSVSHDDAAGAVVAALGVPSGVYNVADDEPVRRREYYDSLAAVLGVRPPTLPPAWLARVTGSVGETLSRSQRISNRKFREASGWRPTLPSVRDGWAAVLRQLQHGQSERRPAGRVIA